MITTKKRSKNLHNRNEKGTKMVTAEQKQKNTTKHKKKQ